MRIFFKDDDDAKVKYYTGLPCLALLMGVVTQLLPCLPQNGRKLSPFQMLLSTLMRLRLNLQIQHIAYLFSVDRKTVSTTFRDTIGTMFKHLKPLVHWPESHCLQATMPHQFVEAFGNRVAVIVDCFEIRIERASNLKARAQTFSHYKRQHTLKYLIGSTPRVSISFVSQGWGGHVSDKLVTENSGLLNELLPGDLVLTGRGFDIRDCVGLVCRSENTCIHKRTQPAGSKRFGGTTPDSSPQGSCGEGDWMCTHNVHHTKRNCTSQHGTPMSRWRHDVPGQDCDCMLCLD